MDSDQNSFIETFRTFLEDVIQSSHRDSRLTPMGELVEQHLGADATAVPAVTETILGHRLVDADLAMAELRTRSESRLVGISHGQMRMGEDLPGLLTNSHVSFAPGPVDYVSIATGPDTERQVVASGLHLFEFRGQPVAVLQREARPQFGQEHARLEIMATDPAITAALIREVRQLMVHLSVLRGQVLSLTGSEFGNGAAGAAFLARPTVAAGDVVLADGVLDQVVRHVVGIGAQRERLVAAGQHLKRGVLLYGPPGTGKTLTVRHLLARTPGTTAVLLTGPGIRFITEAAELARAMQPAIVVLEDVDLVAGDREMHFGPQPLLFSVLDALDGLDGDADVTFLLTTNRVELLERALAERPGRVDLAVEIDLPDADTRRRLFALYSNGLPFSSGAVVAAADRATGVTGSFAKELVRRAVLTAAEASRDVTDDDLADALEQLLSAREALTRSLLGGPGGDEPGIDFGQGDDDDGITFEPR
ncbi:AAA family ATPase [Marisediminicola senii]|uniref:AAA family ATPase n=1 Tax=Marisediminicola senii TaxID=2711233 RepID=UPI0013EA31FA|nr:ATP-binding protein [Marisediminicola senii]